MVFVHLATGIERRPCTPGAHEYIDKSTVAWCCSIGAADHAAPVKASEAGGTGGCGALPAAGGAGAPAIGTAGTAASFAAARCAAVKGSSCVACAWAGWRRRQGGAAAGAAAAAAASTGDCRPLPLPSPAHLLVVQGHQGAGLLVARRLPENGRRAGVEGVAHCGLLRSPPGAEGGEGGGPGAPPGQSRATCVCCSAFRAVSSLHK